MGRLCIPTVFVALGFGCAAMAGDSTAPQMPKNLAATLDLYLSSSPRYQDGDLISVSHLKEFQLYLRRTKGHSIATHPRWHQRMLPDQDALVHAFYNGGADVLRKAAKATKGYDAIHQITRLPMGRKTIKSIAREKSVQRVLDAVAEYSVKQVTTEKPDTSSRRTTTVGFLYTAAEFVAAVEDFATSKAKQAAPDEKAEVVAN